MSIFHACWICPLGQIVVISWVTPIKLVAPAIRFYLWEISGNFLRLVKWWRGSVSFGFEDTAVQGTISVFSFPSKMICYAVKRRIVYATLEILNGVHIIDMSNVP